MTILECLRNEESCYYLGGQRSLLISMWDCLFIVFPFVVSSLRWGHSNYDCASSSFFLMPRSMCESLLPSLGSRWNWGTTKHRIYRNLSVSIIFVSRNVWRVAHIISHMKDKPCSTQSFPKTENKILSIILILYKARESFEIMLAASIILNSFNSSYTRK